MTERRYGPESPADILSRMLARRGVNIPALRLEEELAAQRSRTKLEDREHLQDARTLGSRVKKASRAVAVATDV
jgi:hypothetical protein